MRARPPLAPGHPYPELAAEFGPRGWTIFRTCDAYGVPSAYGVFCAPLPLPCPTGRTMRVHVVSTPDDIGAELTRAAGALEAHARTCAVCAEAVCRAGQRASGP